TLFVTIGFILVIVRVMLVSFVDAIPLEVISLERSKHITSGFNDQRQVIICVCDGHIFPLHMSFHMSIRIASEIRLVGTTTLASSISGATVERLFLVHLTKVRDQIGQYGKALVATIHWAKKFEHIRRSGWKRDFTRILV